jgi:DNA modification methylase
MTQFFLIVGVSISEELKMGVQAKNKANQLDGKTWLKNSISIWSDIKKTKDELQLKHPAMFPIALASRLIECFTDQDDPLIFDPFAGVGSTLVAAKELGKDSVGIEISDEFVGIANNRLSQVLPLKGDANAIIYEADSRETLKYLEPSSVDMVITSPPYWDILLQKRTA